MRTKRILALLMSLAMVFACLPAVNALASDEGTKIIGDGGLVLDTDPTGGYEGDYVVIYNPATSSSTSYSTGNMSGLIETQVASNVQPAREQSERMPAIIDVDGELAARERAEFGDAYGKIDEEGGVRASYQVGSTRNFTISSYSPGSSSMQFKVLAVGQHCYIWTPSTNATNYYTLDSINASYAQTAADEFDRMYDLMNSSFGSHSNGSNGDGKVSLLFYNIDDGFDPNGSSGYIAGYFSSASYMYDGLPIINIDTYPGIYYVSASGTDYTTLDRAFGTACHEYQHCINYSNTSGMSTWLNECFSAAAEEICYPGSSIVSRIQSWENYFYSSNGDWLNPPEEFQYQSSFNLHNGYSMYGWSNDLTDVLALYAQVSMFAQYLYTQFGNGIYKQISNRFSSSEPTAITNATGMSCTELVKNFRIAIYANDHAAFNGQYGFIPQADYDPSQYANVENPYNLLGPVVFTGTSCSIKGGGAICVKPVNGVYNPPSGANSSLVYIGITRNINAEPVELTGIAINPSAAEVMTGMTTNLSLVKTPSNANNYEVTWTSSRPSVATVSGSKTGATVTGVTAGTAVITATATDLDTNAVYTASATVTVTEFEGYVLVDSIENGGKYIIVANSSISGTTGYAVGNTVVSNNRYLTPVAVTINSDDTCTVSSANEPKVVWVAAGNDTNGYSFYNEAVGKYMGLDSSQYLSLTSDPLAWKYDSSKRLDNQVDTDSYYYLSYTTSSTVRYTTSKASTTSDLTIKLYKLVTASTPEPVYYTVTFKDWDGTVLSTQQVEEGGAATAPANPSREGYMFLGWDVDFSNVTGDLIVTAQYSIRSYNLVIFYQYEDGTAAAASYAQSYYYGSPYSVTSPVIEGYTADITVVEGVMGAGNVTVTVTYTQNPVEPDILLGDVDCNGEVNFADVTALYMFLIGSDELTEQGMLNADVNQDGLVDFGDVGILYGMLI